MIRAFLKDCVAYTLPTLFSRALSIFLIPLYTRILSPKDYGSLDLLIVFAGFVNLTVALEVSQGLARYYVDEVEPDRKLSYASSSLWFTILCYSLFAGVSLIFAPYFAHFVMGQEGLEKAFRLGIAFIWINGLFLLVQNQFRWELRSQEYALVSLLMSTTTAASSVFFAFWLRWGLEGMLLGLVIGNLVGTSFGLWRLKRSFRFRFDIKCVRKMLAFSVPLLISGIAVWISLYVDRIMIRRLLSVEAVGLYGVGYRVASIAGLAMVGFQGALTPLVYSHYQDPSTPIQLARIFRLFMLFALFMFLLLVLYAKDILRFLTTDQFYGGAVVVGYLVPSILLSRMYIFAPGISITKKTHLIVWINICGAILNIILNFSLIPHFGIIGAGLATLISSLSVFLAYMLISQKFYPVPHQWFPIISASAFAVVIGCINSMIYGEYISKFGINIGLIFIFFIFSIIVKLIDYKDIYIFNACIKDFVLKKILRML